MITELTVEERKHYARHLILPEIGEEGQSLLKRAKVLMVGVGGLGCPCSMYLAAAGVGTLGIVDFDIVEESNLQRQVLYDVSALGRNKAEEAVRRLRLLNPHIELLPYIERLSAANAEELIEGYDLVVDGTDNFATRYLINDVCVVSDKPFVAASISRFQGQLAVFNLKLDRERGPTYRCLFPEPPDPEQARSCSDIGVLGAVPGVLGTLQAAEVIKVLLGVGKSLSGRLLLVNLLTMDTRTLGFSRNDEIVKKTKLLSDKEYSVFCQGNVGETVRSLSAVELKQKISSGEDLMLIDVREPYEREIAHIGGELIPPSRIIELAPEIPRDRKVVFYCRSGVRSRQVIRQLQQQFSFSNLYNLEGGLLAWADKVDPSLVRY